MKIDDIMADSKLSHEEKMKAIDVELDLIQEFNQRLKDELYRIEEKKRIKRENRVKIKISN